MTKLISGRVHKVPSANVSAERYQFLEISEAEPDLGLPSQLGQVFTSDLNGNRYWVRLDTANVAETTNQYFTNVRVLQAVDPRLTTANVLELTNQYFSNVRVLQVVDPKLTTANVTELNNLYFTAQRAIAALEGNNVVVNNLTVSGDLEVQGNLVSINTATLNVEDKNILIANGAINPGQANGAGITIAGANAEITYQDTGDQFNINKNVNVQGNITIDGKFIGNGLVIRNIVVSDEILTGNILGQGFTSNTIVVSETLTANVITANVVTSKEWYGIYTANVLETPGNLYYTNDRVFSFVTGMSIGDLVDVANIYTHQVSNALIGIQQGQALVWNGNIFIPTFVNSEVANVADLSVKVLSLENQTTANVREAASNLYFTNTRVLDAISLATINPDNVNANNIVTNVITANIWNRLYTANVIETSGNLYFTTARTVDTVTPLLTTANVIEATSNLYFTTARARNSVSNSTGVYYSSDTGVFSIGQDVAITSDVQFRDLTLSGNLFILGNVAIIAANTLEINDPIIHLGLGNPGDQWDIGFVGHYIDVGDRHTGLFRDATDKKFKFFSNTTVDPSNVNYIDTTEDSFRLASVVAETFEGNVVGTVSSLANHTTDALAEGQNNLYYTNARTVQTVTPLLTTSNVVEGTNLYFTNARVLANVEQMSINVLADVDITGVSVNSALVWDGTKFIPGSTEAAIRSNFANTAGSANVALLADLANLVSSLSNHDTANLAEGTNLYFTNARVTAVVQPLLTTANVIETSGNLYFTTARTVETVTPLLTTANVVETTNQYFTNAKVTAVVQPLLTTANVIETSANLYFTNARTVQAVTPLLTTANVIETSANLYFTNARVLASLVNANVLVADLTAAGNITANGLIIRGILVNDNILSGNVTITNITNANVVSANIISSQVWQGLYSGNIIESTNLFFSNTRARGAFIAGRGIIIMDNGTIKSAIGTENFNTAINLGQSYTVTSALAPALTIASTPTVDRYLVRSMHLTNISETPALVSANVLYATGNTATLANLISVPVGGIVEFMDRIQVLQPGDKINVQGFNNAGTPTSNILSLNFSIEQISDDATYYGTSFTLASSNVETTLISTSQSYAVIESVKFVNLTSTSVPVRLYTKNSNNVIKSYLAYNTQVPPNSSLEILQSPKTLEFTDTLYASYTNTSANSAIAVFPSYRYSTITTLEVSTASATPGDNVIISFATSAEDGSTLYYTLE